MIKALAVLSAAAIVLGGCASAPPAGTDWIDVPLSPNTWWGADAPTPYREAEYRIPLAAGEALEHMLTLQQGAFVSYSWDVAMDQPGLLTAEFHGHTERAGTEPGTVMFYKIHQDGRESGTLRAPFSGVHGWYFNNESNQDIEIVLRAAGFFTD
jgi:hypothetical protein